jgi:hypothetical protein
MWRRVAATHPPPTNTQPCHAGGTRDTILQNPLALVSDCSSMACNQLNPLTPSSAQSKKRKRREVGLKWMIRKTKNLNKVENNPKTYVCREDC